ncbi:hypothetical protein Taro_030837, partial [Colocasia esculenta]|nr:hypothetical protein [Colocasia esculenta]
GGTCLRERRISLEHEPSGSLPPRLISESCCGRPGTRRQRSQKTYDRTMVDHYTEGIPQQDLDSEAWVDVAGGGEEGLSSLLWPTRVHLLRHPATLEMTLEPSSGKAVIVAAAAPWRHGRAADGSHPRSRHLTASPSG